MTGQRPIKAFRVGGVRAAIWENTVTRNGRETVVHSVQIDRTYKDGEEWKQTNRFDVRDLPKVELAAAKAFDFICLKNGEQSEGP